MSPQKTSTQIFLNQQFRLTFILQFSVVSTSKSQRKLQLNGNDPSFVRAELLSEIHTTLDALKESINNLQNKARNYRSSRKRGRKENQYLQRRPKRAIIANKNRNCIRN